MGAHRNFDLNDRHFFVFKLHFARSLRHFSYSENEFLDSPLHLLEQSRHMILKRPTPYEELGGEFAIKIIVENMFINVMKNDMLAPYFRDKNLDTLKNGFSAFLSQELGGTQNYKGMDIKVLHARMSLTDFHLDGIRDCLEKALKEQNIDESVIRDVIWVLEKQRRNVVMNSIYEIVGGEETIMKTVGILLKKVRKHYSLGKFFEKKSEEEEQGSSAVEKVEERVEEKTEEKVEERVNEVLLPIKSQEIEERLGEMLEIQNGKKMEEEKKGKKRRALPSTPGEKRGRED